MAEGKFLTNQKQFPDLGGQGERLLESKRFQANVETQFTSYIQDFTTSYPDFNSCMTYK